MQKNIFGTVTHAPPDGIMGIRAKYLADPRKLKIDLSVGFYQNDKSCIEKLAIVTRAEREIFEQQAQGTISRSPEYLPMSGYQPFVSAAKRLVLGEKLIGEHGPRVASIQSPAGSGALRLGAEFLKRHCPGSPIYLSDPTWAPHRMIFDRAGLKVLSYPYYDYENHGNIKIDSFLECLSGASARSIFLLQASCHNPTGMDFTESDLAKIAKIAIDRDLIIFFDMAYQGLGDGLDSDAYAIRDFIKRGMTVLVAQSFSKNLSLYNRRTGALHVAVEPEQVKAVASQLETDMRGLISNCPIDGALIAAHIFNDQELNKAWESELGTMRSRLTQLRTNLAKELAQAGLSRFAHITKQKGMFSFTGLSQDEVIRLREEFGIYMLETGRLCVPAINSENIIYLVDSIVKVAQKTNSSSSK